MHYGECRYIRSMTKTTAAKQGLETVFPENTEAGRRIFYDVSAGEYYDAATDLYLFDFDPTEWSLTRVVREGE